MKKIKEQRINLEIIEVYKNGKRAINLKLTNVLLSDKLLKYLKKELNAH